MSLYSEINPEKRKKLQDHTGHQLVITNYEEEITIECEDFQEILISFFEKEVD
jgi:hypothetical protein